MIKNSRYVEDKKCDPRIAMNEQQRRTIPLLGGCNFRAIQLLGFFTLLLILSDVGICYVEKGNLFVIQCLNLTAGR